MILTLVGVSRGMLNDQKQRSRGVGADIIVRPPGSAAIGLTGNFNEKILPFLQKQPHVAEATGILVAPTGPLTSITGLDFPAFQKMSGNFRFLQGGPVRNGDEVVVDEYYANEHKLKPGSTLHIFNRDWRVTGVFEQGKLARIVTPLKVLQSITANTGKLSAIYVKLDDPALTDQVIQQLKKNGLEDYQVISMEALLSQMSVNNIPVLKAFIGVVITLGVIVGFLVVFLSMYTAVLERTREIGILKALGASPGFVLAILLRETTVLAVIGTLIGIGFSYVTKWLITTLVPGSLMQAIVPDWWPIAGAIALAGSLLGAFYPGMKAARQDAIEALAYD
jgi:putative ABC transport system permease protein